jgi:AraC family transcriptional regulator of adaptative response / DNA-3-methyladenine glycosylase II
MNLQPDICYQALRSHDARFDGVFFVAVRTTRIYCRPICPARTPKFESCIFYPSAAAAEKKGYRPCLRCRPELAPGNASVDAVSRMAALAMNRIEDGALTEGSIEDLAASMGISARHLRRVVESEFGVSPIQIAQTQRLLLAKRLLTDTTLPVTEIALASGFSSLRRFNALFLERYRMNPSNLRKTGKNKRPVDYLTCELVYKQPFDWSAMLNFLRSRACPGVEIVTDETYARTVSTGKHKGWIKVENSKARDRLLVSVSSSLAPVLLQVTARVKRLFDLHLNPTLVVEHLGALARPNPGLRVPGAFDGFELAVRGLLGQVVSVKAATTLSGRVTRTFGQEFETMIPGLVALPPSSADLAKAKIEDFVAIGIPATRASAIIQLSRLVESGELHLEPGSDYERTVATLKSTDGIGDWTAEYIAMRCLAWPDAFPYSDLGIKKALAMSRAKELIRAAEKWRPWRSYATMHLWKSLEKKDEAVLYILSKSDRTIGINE